MSRQEIYKALTDLVSSVTEFNTVSSRLKVWTEVAVPDMPALFVVSQDELANTTRGLDTIWTLQTELYIYVSVGNDPNASPNELLNPIIDSISDLFDWKKLREGVQTFNGLVHSCKINGGIKRDGGLLGTVAIAIIPVEIITNI